MKFTRQDTPTIMDGMVVRYRHGGFEINASRNGVSTSGFMPLIRSQEDLDIVFEYLRRAFQQYTQLAPNAHIIHGRNNPLPEEAFETPAAQPGFEKVCPKCGCGYMQKRPSAPNTDWVCTKCGEPVNNLSQQGAEEN